MKSDDMSIFAMMLPDFSAPAYVTISKPYFGTKHDADSFLMAMKHEDSKLIVKPSTRFTPVQCVKKATVKQNIGDCRYINTWGFPYIVHWDEAVFEYIWVQWNEGYWRCVRARFRDLQYRRSEKKEPFLPVRDMLWGFPNIVYFASSWLSFRLYTLDNLFQDSKGFMADMNEKPVSPDYQEIFNNIFADG